MALVRRHIMRQSEPALKLHPCSDKDSKIIKAFKIYIVFLIQSMKFLEFQQGIETCYFCV